MTQTLRYSVNIFDLDRLGPIVPFLLGDVIPNRISRDVEPGRIDGKAVVLECDDERAEAIVGVIRLKQPKNLVRCYRGKRRI